MQKPRLYGISAFDATVGATVTFSWEGEQAFGSRLVILNNETRQVVYDNIYTAMTLQHVIPPNTSTEITNDLVNGICYYATIYVIGRSGDVVSDESNSVLFYCYSTPQFEFSNIVNNQTIESSSFTAQLSYSQNEGETLSEYQIGLYDHSHNLISTSGTLYVTSNPEQSYMFNGLTDSNSYYIRATGQTQNGITVDTGYIYIVVKYSNPYLFSHLVLECNKKEACIIINSNLITSEGKLDHGDPIYIDGKYLDLRENKIVFDDGFSFSDNFSLAIAMYNIEKNLPLLTLSDGKYEASLYYREKYQLDGTVKGFFELKVSSSIDSNCIYFSDLLSPIQESDSYVVWIQFKNNLPKLYVVLSGGDG